MSYIKEPKGIDFVVAPSELSTQDITVIQSAIDAYKNNRQKSQVTALSKKGLQGSILQKTKSKSIKH
jgi:hypothetical protein